MKLVRLDVTPVAKKSNERIQKFKVKFFRGSSGGAKHSTARSGFYCCRASSFILICELWSGQIRIQMAHRFWAALMRLPRRGWTSSASLTRVP